MISEIRKYFKDVLATINLKEVVEGFDPIESSLTIDNSYHFSYSIGSIEYQNQSYVDNTSCVLRVYKKSYKNTQLNFDACYDLGHAIRSEVENLTTISTYNLNKSYPILRINTESIEVLPLETNDNISILNIKFNVKRIFTICT